MLPDQELARTTSPAIAVSLAEELEINPAAAILQLFRKSGGDDTELAQALSALKQKEEAKT